jgi:hypothetical protein
MNFCSVLAAAAPGAAAAPLSPLSLAAVPVAAALRPAPRTLLGCMWALVRAGTRGQHFLCTPMAAFQVAQPAQQRQPLPLLLLRLLPLEMLVRSWQSSDLASLVPRACQWLA